MRDAAIQIQVADASVWRTIESGLPNDPQWYSRAMREASRAYPVDSEVRVVDIL